MRVMSPRKRRPSATIGTCPWSRMRSTSSSEAEGASVSRRVLMCLRTGSRKVELPRVTAISTSYSSIKPTMPSPSSTGSCETSWSLKRP